MPPPITGWAAMAYPRSELGDIAEIGVRLAFDPNYRLLTDRGRATPMYALLLCHGPYYKFHNFRIGIFLWGSARLNFPLQLTWDETGNEAGLTLPPNPQLGLTIRNTNLTIDQRRWHNVQQLTYRVPRLVACGSAPPRTLAPSPNFTDSFGADAYSSLVIIGGLGKKENTGSYLGIRGPRNVYTTPFIGGVPNSESGQALGLANGWFVQSDVPAEVAQRAPSSTSTFLKSDPPSNDQASLDVLSTLPISAHVFTINRNAASDWSNIHDVALVLAGIGAAIIASLIYDLARRTNEAPMVSADTVPAKSQQPPKPSSTARAASPVGKKRTKRRLKRNAKSRRGRRHK